MLFAAVSAVPAKRGKMVVTQPDGTKLTVSLHGDENSHYYEAEDGALMLYNHQGMLCYATIDAQGKAVASTMAATDVGQRNAEAVSFVKQQDRTAIMRDINKVKRSETTIPGTISRSFPTTGVVKGLVILAEYQDVKFQPDHTREVYDDMSNTPNYSGPHASGSVYDYFVAQSYGKFTPQFDVVGPVTLPHDMAYYGLNENVKEMIIDACNVAKGELGTDFSNYDANNDGNVDFVFVIYAGYGQAQGGPAESVWPSKVDLTYANWETYDGLYLGAAACTCELHGYEGTEMDGIGTFCHEFSHILGLPDVYDTAKGGGFGMNDWDVMDHGCYLDESRTPAGYTAMDRYSVGWLEPKVIMQGASNIMLPALEESGDAYFMVCESDKNEYYTIENRQQIGWDKALPGHGMLISHIHYEPLLWTQNLPNASTKQYEHIALVAADNDRTTESLSGDTYPGTTGKTTFGPETTPAAFWHTTINKPNYALTNIREMGYTVIFDVSGESTDVSSAQMEYIKISTGKSAITIVNPEKKMVSVVAADGTIVRKSTAEWQQIDVAHGLYIVNCEGKITKVMVE